MVILNLFLHKMQSELAQLRLEREKREREKRQLEEEETLPVPTSAKSLEDIQEKEMEERRLEEEEMSKRIIIREETRDYINTSIEKDIRESLDRIEAESFQFARLADDKNIEEMMQSLESIHGELLHIKELLLQYRTVLLDVHKKTSRIDDVNWIIKETFSMDAIKEQVRQALDFLNGVSSALLDINLDIAGARRPVKLLQDIFDIGTADFGFPYREIVIDMDISRDEEFALNLARTQERLYQEETPRFTSFPTRHLGPSRRDLSLTPSRRSLGIDAARKIVAENVDVDRHTLQAILEPQGFTLDIITEALGTRETREETEIFPPTRETTAREISETSEETEILPPPRETIPYKANIEALSIRDLVKIAKAHGLMDYRRKSKVAMIRYLEENLDTVTLNAAIREKIYPIRYTNLPVIFAG